MKYKQRKLIQKTFWIWYLPLESPLKQPSSDRLTEKQLLFAFTLVLKVDFFFGAQIT